MKTADWLRHVTTSKQREAFCNFDTKRTSYCAPKQGPGHSIHASFTRAGNTLHMPVHFWPGEYVAIGGLMTMVKAAKLVKTGASVPFKQDEFRVRFTDLPAASPDHPVTTIAIECESEPTQDTDFVRKNKPRMGV